MTATNPAVTLTSRQATEAFPDTTAAAPNTTGACPDTTAASADTPAAFPHTTSALPTRRRFFRRATRSCEPTRDFCSRGVSMSRGHVNAQDAGDDVSQTFAVPGEGRRIAHQPASNMFAPLRRGTP